MNFHIKHLHDSDTLPLMRILDDLECEQEAQRLLEYVKSEDRNGIQKIKKAVSLMDIKSQSRLKALFKF